MLNSEATGVLKKCNPDLPVFMSQLCDRIQAAFTGCRSILLYGDAAEGDFSQKFSTADVIAVCKLDLSTPEAKQKAGDIYAFAKEFPKEVGHLLNLYLVHRDAIADPTKHEAGFRVSKHGAHVLEKYPFSQVTNWHVKHKGVVLFGDDERADFREVDKGFAVAREFKHEFNENIVRADFSKEPFNLPASVRIDEDKFVDRCVWMCGGLCSLLTESIPTKTGGLAWYNNRFGGLIQHFPDKVARVRNSYYELQDPQTFIRKLHPDFPRFLVHFVNQVCLHEGHRGDFNLKAIALSYHGWDYMELGSWLNDRFGHH